MLVDAEDEQSTTSLIHTRSDRSALNPKRWTGTRHYSTQPHTSRFKIKNVEQSVSEVHDSNFQQNIKLSSGPASNNFPTSLAGPNRFYNQPPNNRFPLMSPPSESCKTSNHNKTQYDQPSGNLTPSSTVENICFLQRHYGVNMEQEDLQQSASSRQKTSTRIRSDGGSKERSNGSSTRSSVGFQKRFEWQNKDGSFTNESKQVTKRPYGKKYQHIKPVPSVSAGRDDDSPNKRYPKSRSANSKVSSTGNTDETLSCHTPNLVRSNVNQKHSVGQQEFFEMQNMSTNQEESNLFHSASSNENRKKKTKRSRRSKKNSIRNNEQSSVYGERDNKDKVMTSWATCNDNKKLKSEDLSTECESNPYTSSLEFASVFTNENEIQLESASAGGDPSKPKRIRRKKKKVKKEYAQNDTMNEVELAEAVYGENKVSSSKIKKLHKRNRTEGDRKDVNSEVPAAKIDGDKNTPKKNKLWKFITAIAKHTPEEEIANDAETVSKISPDSLSTNLHDSSFSDESCVNTHDTVSRKRKRRVHASGNDELQAARNYRSIDKKIPSKQSSKPVFAVIQTEMQHQANVSPKLNKIGSKHIERVLGGDNGEQLAGAGEQMLYRIENPSEITGGLVENDYVANHEKRIKIPANRCGDLSIDQAGFGSMGETLSGLDIDEECVINSGKTKSDTTGSLKVHDGSSIRTESDLPAGKQAATTASEVFRKFAKFRATRKPKLMKEKSIIASESVPSTSNQTEPYTIRDVQANASRSESSGKRKLKKSSKQKDIESHTRSFAKKLRSLKLRGVSISQPSEQKLEITFNEKFLSKKHSETDWLDNVILALVNKEKKNNLSKKETANVMKNHSYAFRRRIIIDTVKDNCCIILLPLIVLMLMLTLIFGYLFSILLFAPAATIGSETATSTAYVQFLGEDQLSRTPITGLLHVLDLPNVEGNLQSYAKDWQSSLASQKWTREVLSNALKEVYRKAGVPVDNVMITNLSLFADPNLNVVSSYQRKKPAVIKYRIQPNGYNNGPLRLDDVMHKVGKSLRHSTNWQFDPNYFELSQGNITEKANTLQSFLSKDVPPLDMYLAKGGYSWQITYNMTCPKLLTQANVQVYPLNCKVNTVSPVNQTCRFFCPDGFKLTGDEYTVCLANGIWSGRQAYCSKSCPGLPPLEHGRIMPSSCSKVNSSTNVLSNTRCMHFCYENYQLFGTFYRKCLENGKWSHVEPICKKECSRLKAPQFGKMFPLRCSTDDSVEGDVCNFFCDDGYALQGGSSASCDNDGRWTQDVPGCRNICPNLNPVSNTTVYPFKCGQSLAFEGMSCQYSCQDGYQLIGSRIRSCGSNRVWSGYAPQCIRTCTPFRELSNGRIIPSTCALTPQLAMSSCVFACDTGFVLKGNESLTCSKNGLWNETQPVCLAKCPPLEIENHGVLNCTGNMEDSACVLHCLKSQQLRGAQSVTCGKDGTWSAPLGTCLETCPKILVPSHGYVAPEECSTGVSTVNDTCTFYCEKTYGISGSITKTCLSSGKWSGNHTDCNYENQYFLTLEQRSIHVCLTAKGPKSPKPEKRYHVQCTGRSFDYWSLYKMHLIKNSGNGKCIGFNSPVEMAPLVFMSCNATDPRQIWDFSSNEDLIKLSYYPYYIWYGYSSATEVVASGQVNFLSKWMLYNPDTKSKTTFFGATNNGKCLTLKRFPRGKWMPDSCWLQPSIEETTCTFVCSNGYSPLNYSTTVTCDYGVWTGQLEPSCVQSCPAYGQYSFANGNVTPEECVTANYIQRGETCTFSCDSSYTLVGEPITTCLTNGHWSTPAPQCRKFCSPLTAPVNGEIPATALCENPKIVQEVGSICKVVCNLGYVVKGIANSKCSLNGTWEATGASCVRACYEPNPPNMGEVVCSEIRNLYASTTTCDYKCPKNRILNPDIRNTTCLRNGAWSNYPPDCQNNCPSLPPIDNGRIEPAICTEKAGVLPNKFKCYFTCDFDYMLEGEKSLVCLASGKWSKASPVCRPDVNFLLVHETKNVMRICIAVKEYPYHHNYQVVAVPSTMCNFSEPSHLWSADSLGRIKNVGTGWCLAATEKIKGKMLQLEECDNSREDTQRWESILIGQSVLIRLKLSNYYLQYKSGYVFILDHYATADEINWRAHDLSNNRGTVFGMVHGKNAGTCPKLLLPSGTNVRLITCLVVVNIGTSCYITCGSGYELRSGSTTTTLTCGAFGVWSTTDIYCKRRRCLHLPALPSATVISNATCTSSSFAAFSSTPCTYSCAVGFYLNLTFGASGALYCLGQGQWSEPVPTCMQYCRSLSGPNNGKVSPFITCTAANNATHGQICAFSCKRHFYLKGAQFLLCGKGQWNGTEPRCLQLSGSGRCRGFRSISLNNARARPPICYNKMIPQNTICRISCNPGYSPVLLKDEEAVCQANSEWSSPLPICKKVCSLFPAPVNSDLVPALCNYGTITEGQSCNIVCQKGFALASSGRRTCKDTGTWDNPPPTCQPKVQFMLRVSNECAYAPNGANSWVYFKNCSSDDVSQWWEWLGITKIRNVKTQTCVVPKDLKSYAAARLLDCDLVQHGWDCVFSENIFEGLIYNNKYRLARSISSIPTILFVVNPEADDPEWIPKRVTHLHALRNQNSLARPCLYRSSSNCPPLPPIVNGYLENRCKDKGRNVFVGTTCRYFCDAGYVLWGVAERVCQYNGEWSNPTQVQCRKACQPLRVPDFSTVDPVQCETKEMLEGTSCIFSCGSGLNHSGSKERFCQLDGSWSGLPTICHQSCPALQLSPMLTVTPQTCLISNQVMGSICTASCPVGFTLVGSSDRICQSHGSWTGAVSGCQRACTPLQAVSNGKVLPLDCTENGKFTGNACVFSCGTNYGLVGSRVRTCAEDGLWTGSPAICLRKCPIVTAPFNGMINCRRNQPLAGDMCVYSCDPKYEIVGENDFRTCLDTGRWSGEEVFCVKRNQFALIQSSPNDDEQCLYVTFDNRVAVTTGDSCNIWEETIRWSWHNNLIRHSKSRLCLAGNILESGSHLILKLCNETDSQQIWECSDLERDWFIHLSVIPKLYPLYSPISHNYVLLFTDEGLDLALKKVFLVDRQTQWYAKTFSVERLPVCSARKVEFCKSLNVHSSTVVKPASCLNEEMPIGSMCFLFCPASFILNEPTTETECLPGGHWSFSEIICVPACEPFSMSISGALKVSPPTCSANDLRPESFVCRFSCPPNLLLLGNPVLTCQKNNKWNYEVPRCSAHCPPVNVLNHGRVQPQLCTSSRAKLTEGTLCHYECLQSELVFSGAKVRTCTNKGLWDKPEGRCVKPCPILLPPDHGIVSPPRCSRVHSVAGDNCTFTCSANALLEGPNVRACFPNGTWTGKHPRCKVVCPKLQAPENAIIEPGSCLTDHNSPGQACFLGCSSRHESNGIKATECLASGRWSSTLGKCNKRCPKLEKPSNGEVVPKSCMIGELSFGHECSFSCEHAYILQGSVLRACLNSGKWSGDEAKCAKACSAIGPGLNIRYTPSSCSNQLQIEGSLCEASCLIGMLTRDGLSSSKSSCDDRGNWKQNSIKACYPICNEPVVANSDILCFQRDGKSTFIHTISTVCRVTCNEGFVAADVSESTCRSLPGSYNKPRWSPSLTTCEYDPDPMLIINRVGYEVVCLGIEHKRVVLVEWQQCKNMSRRTKWVWHSEFQIRNAANGYCIDASHFRSNAYVTTSRCNDSNVMQKWTCSDEDPYLVRLVNDALYIDATIKEINGVVLTREKLKFSKMYTYNPDSDHNYGTLCSRRSYKKKGKTCVLPILPSPAEFVQDSCFLGNDIKAGSVCTVLCNVGLKTAITCQPDGLWEPNPEGLCRNPCEPYTLLKPNSVFLENKCAARSVPFGTVCTLACSEGFVLFGKVNCTMCVHGGLWSSLDDYECVIGCPELPPVDNGLLTPIKCVTGVCSLVCFPGYRIGGQWSRTCQNNGQWSGAEFSCVVEVQFSIVSSIRYKMYSLCLEGTRSSCVVKAKCAKTQKLQRWRWNSEYTIENIVTRECLAVDTSRVGGFSMSRRNFIKNGSFISAVDDHIIPLRLVSDGEKNVITKTCDAMDFTQRWDCGSENAFVLHVVARGIYLEAGALFRRNLNVTNTTSSRKVQWLGRFSGRETSVCANRKVGACSALRSIRNGVVKPATCNTVFVIPGTHCEYTCEALFTLTGRNTTTCLSNGEWSNPPPTCLGSHKCSRLQPRSHLVIDPLQCTTGLVSEGKVCKVKCRSGTILKGATQLLCLSDGTWDRTAPTCAVVCPAVPPPAIGSIMPLQCESGNLPSNFVCLSQCMLNTTLVGAVNRTCLSDGSWEGHNAVCEQFCPALKNLTHGKITPKKCIARESASGDICEMVCDFGFALIGKSRISCIGGKWSDAIPLCKPDRCDRITFNKHTESISYSGLVNGAIVSSSVAKIHCKLGYQTVVSPHRVCLPSSDWSVSSETCFEIRCPAINKLYKGNVSPNDCSQSDNGLPVGMVCYFSCSIGYLLEGTTSKECLLSGHWSYPEINLACVDTIPKLYPTTFNIQLYKEVEHSDEYRFCLQITSDNKEFLFEDCNQDNFYQRWKWLGSSQLQNVGSQMCLRLKSATRTAQVETRVVAKYSIYPAACSSSESSLVQCGDVSSEAGRFQIMIGKKVIGASIVEDDDVNVVSWSGEWIDYTRSTSYDMEPPSNNERMPICSFMCGGNFIADTGDFSSPNYPAEYPQNVHCEWVIKAETASRELVVDFSYISFQIFNYDFLKTNECAHDYLEIREEQSTETNILIRICADHEPMRLSSYYGRLRIVFHSDDAKMDDSGRGWSAHWWTRSWPATNPHCGNSDSDIPVITKSESSPIAAAWQVLIIYTERDLCNGVIYTSLFVITSAHCIENFKDFNAMSDEQKVLIMYGFEDQADLIERFQQKNFNKAKKIWLHPKYSRSHFKNDIAMVMTRKEITFGSAIHPICLPSLKQANVALIGFSICWGVQWSRDIFSHKHSSWDFTHYSYLALLDSQECADILQRQKKQKQEENLICAREAEGANVKPALQPRMLVPNHENDEGNILQCRWNGNWYLVGVSSFIFYDDYDKPVYAYTSARYYEEWILQASMNSFFVLRDENLNTFM